MMEIGTAIAYIDNVVGCKLIKKKGTVGIGLKKLMETGAVLEKKTGQMCEIYAISWIFNIIK